MFTRLRKIISLLALTSVLVTLVLPVQVLAQGFTNSVRAFGSQKTEAQQTEVDEGDVQRSTISDEAFARKRDTDYETDWSEVNWDEEVSLPFEEEEFYKQIRELEVKGEMEKIGELKKPVHKLREPEVMDFYGVPGEVQELVQNEQDGESLKNQIKGVLRKVETKEPEAKFLEVGMEDEGEIDHLLDGRDFKKIKSPGKGYGDDGEMTVEVKDKPVHNVPKHMEGSPFNFELPKPGKLQGEEKREVKEAAASLIPTAYAQVGTNPVVTYYDGIEKHPVENILNHLVNAQNADGSFGDYNKYEITAWVAVMLARYGRNNNDQYNGALNYLLTATPQDNREKAIKIRALNDSGKPYQQLYTELMADRNSDGGFGLHKNQASDVVTTLEVTTMLYGLNPVHTELGPSLYYITTQIPADGGMMYTQDSTPSYYLISRTAEHLAKFKTLTVKNPDGSINVSIQDKINVLLNYIVTNYDENTNTLNGSDDLIDMAHAYYVLWGYGIEPDKQAALKEYLFDYSFAFAQYGQSMYTTIAGMKVLAQPDLVMSDLTAVTALETGKTAGFQFKLKNQGYATMDENAIINVFVDNYNIGKTVSCKLQQILLNANEEATVTLALTGTDTISADTQIKLFVDSKNEYDYKNNWHYKDFTFAPEATGKAAVMPFYVVTNYELDQTLPDGTKETWPGFNIRWKKDDDTRRTGYAVMYREKGTTQWNQAIIDPTWNGTFAGFKNGEGKVYEVTAGVEYLDPSTQTKQVVYYNNPVEITMSADPTKYTSNVEGYVTVDGEKGIDDYVWGYGVDGYSDYTGDFSFQKTKHGSNALRVYEDQYEEIYTKFALPLAGTTKDVRVYTRLKDDSQAPVINDLYINGSQTTMKVKNQQQKQIQVIAQDNIGIDSVDFYYWDVKEQSWRFIESRTFQSSSGGWIDWYIPKEMLGTGYKLKAIAWDYQGNKSAAKEWGPFEVVDGTPPTGTIQVDGLPASGGQWSLGETKTISWNLTTANPVAGINSIQFIDGTTGVIASSVDKNATSIQYTIPTSTSYVGTDVRLKIDVCDTNFNCADVESTQKFNIVDNTPGPHAPWGTPWISDGNQVGNGIDGYLAEVFDDGTTKEFVYREIEGQPFTSPGQYDRLMYRKQVNGVWQTPVKLQEYLYDSKATPKQDDYDFHDISAVKGANGDIHIVYRRHKSGTIADLDFGEVFYVRVSGGALATVKQITNNNIDSSYPAVAVNSQNKVFIAWREGYSYATSSGVSTLHVIEGDGASNWSAITDLSNVKIDSPKIVIENDLPVVNYVYYRQPFVVRKTTSGWGNPIPVKNPGVSKSDIDQYSADQSKFGLIVKDDPNDSSRYLWLDSIKTSEDLDGVLTTNGFTEKEGIMNEWFYNHYIYYNSNKHFYALGGNSYDLLYKSGSPRSKYEYDMNYMNFAVDWNAGTAEMKKHKIMLETPEKEQIQDFQAERNSQGLYHLFFVYRVDTPYQQRAMHGIFDGTGTYFVAPIASRATYTDTTVKGSTNVNDKVTFYINGSTGGKYGTLANTADYGPYLGYRLDAVSPGDQATGVTGLTDLEWKAGAGSFVKYDVVFGQNWDFMSNVASGVTGTKVSAPSVGSGATYYWQVVGEDSAGRKIYSNPWRFDTGVVAGDQPEIEVTQDGNGVASGDTVDFGMAGLNVDTELEFVVKNTGPGDLKLLTTPKVAVSGTDADQFTVLNEAGTPVASGATTSFKVRFKATSGGVKNAKLTLSNNDADEGTFEINVKGEGLEKPASDVALASKGATVSGGSDAGTNAALIDGSLTFDASSGFVQTAYDSSTSPLTIELDKTYMLNTMRLYLPDDTFNNLYYYRIKVSVDGANWDLIHDRYNTQHRSWQLAKFDDRPVKFIRIESIYGTSSLFKAVELEAFYDETPVSTVGLDKPLSDVALGSNGARFYGGQYPVYIYPTVKNSLAIDGKTDTGVAMQYTPSIGDGQEFILELDKHYTLNTLEVQLYDSGAQTYSFTADVSADGKNWTQVMDYSNDIVKGTQTQKFADSVVKFVRINGTTNASNFLYISEIETYYDPYSSDISQLPKPSSDVALASKGATISGGSDTATNPVLIDGVITGYTDTSGFTQTKADSQAANDLIIKLDQRYALNRIRVLALDTNFGYQFSYKVAVSTDASNWEDVMVMTNGTYRSWQMGMFDDKAVQYIRIRGSNSSDGFLKLVEVQAFYQDVPTDISTVEKPSGDVALGSKGARVYGGLYPVYQFPSIANEKLIDGNDENSSGIAMSYINTPERRDLLVELDKHYNLNTLKLKLYDESFDYQSHFKVEASADGKTWTTVMDRSTGSNRSWQFERFNDTMVKYLKIKPTLAYTDNQFRVVELEAYYDEAPTDISTLTKPATDVALSSLGAEVFGGEYPVYLYSTISNARLINGITTGEFAMHYINSGPRQYLMVELDKYYDVNTVKVHLYDGNPPDYSFEVEVSADAKNWTKVMDRTQTRVNGVQTEQFNDSIVKYVRIRGTDAVDKLLRVKEVEVMYQ